MATIEEPPTEVMEEGQNDNEITSKTAEVDKNGESVKPTAKLPQKKLYRQRAHSNPISDHHFDYPISPDLMDWTTLYPKFFQGPDSNDRVEFLDVGCGYGGLLVELSPLFPEKIMLGMEIRVKVSQYVMDRVKALRELHPGSYENIACIRTNAMKYLPNFFTKGQLTKMFFLYPDPHFKRCKHKWRIINQNMRMSWLKGDWCILQRMSKTCMTGW